MDVKSVVRKALTENQVYRLRSLQHSASVVANYPRCAANRMRIGDILEECPRVHIGCSRNRIEGFVNIDYRPTSATDLAFDCSDLSFLGTNRLELIYSNAFFEHLYIEDRQRCLTTAHDALKPGGEILFTGIPDFRALAQAYLDEAPGITTERFDLSQVYRYTHGEPEGMPGWWLAQLHKSLFDVATVKDLMDGAGFQRFVIFNYAFRDEPVPLNLGWLGLRGSSALDVDRTLDRACEINSDIRPASIDVKHVS